MSDHEAALARALEALKAGRAAEAETQLRGIVAAEPGSVAALQLLGTALSSAGRAAEALEWLDRAAQLQDATPTLLHNRAQALFALSRFAEARRDLERALAVNAALQPAWNLLGSVHAALGNAQAAESAYDRAIALRPDHAGARFNRAMLLHKQGRFEEAIAGYRAALAAQPSLEAARDNLADAMHALGIARAEDKRFDQAVELYQAALALRPGHHQARNDLGVALTALERLEEARACFDAVLSSAPDHADALTNLGLAHYERGETQVARGYYQRALSAHPGHVEALNDLAQVEQDEGRRDAAMALYRRAMEADPAAVVSGYNLALLTLAEFDFAAGWDLYELRFETVPPMVNRRRFAIPELAADEIGKRMRLAVWSEQGVGDELLYSTLLPELEQRAQPFVLETDRRLVAAYRRAHPGWTVVSREESNAAFADCDRHIALASLPRLLRRTREAFERQPLSVVAADAARAAAYRERLAPPGGKLIGISWRSFQGPRRGRVQRKKSATLDAFLELSRRADVALLDLQYGDTAAERAEFARKAGRLARLEELDLFNDLDGVLAAIAACDAVLTTSNVTAHLAGALGKRTLLVYLAANPPFHYWASDASGRCLWYPSMRIVTGAGIDSWKEALERAGELLGP